MRDKSLKIRHATKDDLEFVAGAEAIGFPPEEADTKESIKERIATCPNCFWLCEVSGENVAYVNGLLSSEEDLCDPMYEDSSYHDPEGEWLMILGVSTLPEQRGHGYARKCVNASLDAVHRRGLKGAVLSCKKRLISFYETMGFELEGKSSSTLGGAVWYQMRYVA